MSGGDDTTNNTTAAHSGRGGAGNIQPKSPSVDPSSLHTPTLKQATYTTGRGGSGNMARNDPARPEVARAAQDVEAPVAAELRTSLGDGPAAFHTGRGGAANVVRAAGEDGEEQQQRRRERSKSREGKGESIVERGKEILGLKK